MAQQSLGGWAYLRVALPSFLSIQDLSSKLQAQDDQGKDLRKQGEVLCMTAVAQAQIMAFTQALAQEVQVSSREAMEVAELRIKELQTEVETLKVCAYC
jgi:frataxin-like iron-binding protein CyaY